MKLVPETWLKQFESKADVHEVATEAKPLRVFVMQHFRLTPEGKLLYDDQSVGSDLNVLVQFVSKPAHGSRPVDSDKFLMALIDKKVDPSLLHARFAHLFDSHSVDDLSENGKKWQKY